VFSNFFIGFGLGSVKGGYIETRSYLPCGTGTLGDVSGQNYSFTSIRKIKLAFWEFPVHLRYEFANTKWSPFLEAGISYLVYRYSQQVFSDHSIQAFVSSLEDYGYGIIPYQWSTSFSLGMNWQFHERLKLFTQVNYRYHLTETFKGSSAVDEHLYNTVVQSGLRVYLR
jgi:hypothetical protein